MPRRAWSRRNLGPLLGPGLLGLAAAGLFVAAGRLPVVPVPGRLGPDVWPRAVLGGLMVACIAKLIEGARGRQAEPVAAPVDPDLRPLDLRRLAGGIALVLGLPAAVPLLGFPLTIWLFLLGFMRLGGARRPLALLGIATGGTLGLLYVFAKLVYLPLPRGAGTVEDLTLALYRLLGIF